MTVVDDLNSSTFFDGRTIEFLSKLFRSDGKASPLSGIEQKLIDRYPELKELDVSFNGRLVSDLSRYKNYSPVLDAIFFLLEAQKRDVISEAKQILDIAVRDQFVLTAEELESSMADIENFSPDWLVSLFGSDDGDRHGSRNSAKPVSSLNLDAMRDFK